MEPTITINGQELTEAQAMVVRCAVAAFQTQVADEGLGDDEHGKRMSEAYLERMSEINAIIFDTPEPETFGDGLCCLAAHANAKAPWTCPCKCHNKKRSGQ